MSKSYKIPAGEDANRALLDLWSGWHGGIDCGKTGRFWPAGELRAAADAAAKCLTAAGIDRDETVALALSNTVAFPTMLMAVLRTGANAALLYVSSKPAEISRFARSFGIRWLLHDFLEETTTLRNASFPERTRVVFEDMASFLLSIAGADDACESPLPAVEAAVFHPTSGTYGAARLCLRGQGVAVAEAVDFVESIAPYERARVTAATPLSHAYAYGFGMVAAMLTDSTLVIDSAFNPKRLLARENENASRLLALVPPMAKSLAQVSRLVRRRKLAPDVFFAGAPCPLPVATAFQEVFAARLHAIYGTTESGGIATSYSPDTPRPGVGLPLRNVAVDIRNVERYDELGGGTGEIFVRSPSMMEGYVGGGIGPDSEGWFFTGDLGRLDPDGNLAIVGRVREMINLGGMKVDPAEVEALLREHSSVVDAAVYPGLYEDGTEYMQAAVEGDAGQTDVEQLRAFALDRMDPHKVPTRIHVVKALPRTPSGKVVKVQCPGYPESLLSGGLTRT